MSVTRSDVEFRSGDAVCAAWQYRPEADGPVPLVVMAHGFSGTRDQRLDAYAERFAQAGIAALVFDYRHFGASEGQPRQLIDIAKQQADYHAALRYARVVDWVDPDRIAIFGSSFSGGHVVEIAAADPRVAAVISQAPFADGMAALPILGVGNILRGTVAGLRDRIGAALGRPPFYIPVTGEPGSFAIMTTPDAAAGINAMNTPDTLWENRVAARIFLRVGLYRPGRAAAAVRCPLLACVCDGDALAPGDRTVELLSQAPRAEIKRYPVGHFDIYVGEPFERAIADQIAFLEAHLLGHRSTLDAAPAGG